MKTLKSVNRFVESKGVSLFVTVFGACFIVVGVYASGLFQVGIKALWGITWPLQICIGFGVMLFWGGLVQARLLVPFGKPGATVAVAAVKPGEEFEFCYVLPVHRDTEVESVSAFLVLRERVRYYEVDETQTVDFDRLCQTHIQPGRTYHKKETVEVRQMFCVPRGDRGIRNSFMNRKDAKLERMWVIKVRIHRTEGEDIWGEYGLDVPFKKQEPYLPDPEHFEVVLEDVALKNLLAVTRTLEGLLPHLRSTQLGDLDRNCPCLIMEGIPWEEAQRTQQLLENVGAKVTVNTANRGEIGREAN